MDHIELLIPVASFFLTFLLLLILRPLAKKIKLVDHPDHRKKHSNETPLVGGISIFFCFLILFNWLPVQNNAYLIAATLIVVCGIVDDYIDLKPKIRLFIETLAAWIMIEWGGMEITNIGNILAFGDIELGYFSTIFTIFSVVGGINAFNMIDGIDGLAGGISLIVIILIYLVAYDIPEISSICLVFIPAICAFLFFNLRILGNKKASIFLGDTGSMLFGFTICYLVILASQGENKVISPTIAVWILALPLFDSISIMIRRYLKGRSFFLADREHFHHILLLAGYSVNQSLSIILVMSLALGGFGLFAEAILNVPEWKMFYLFISLFCLYYWGMSRSWSVMKIVRYLREKNNDRRKTIRRVKSIFYNDDDRRKQPDRRNGQDRRYHYIKRVLGKKQKREKN